MLECYSVISHGVGFASHDELKQLVIVVAAGFEFRHEELPNLNEKQRILRHHTPQLCSLSHIGSKAAVLLAMR